MGSRSFFMGNHYRREDLDLNQEPSDQTPPNSPNQNSGFGSLLNEFENSYSHIEERIRQLEAVTSRARQRHRWRQSQPSAEPTIRNQPSIETTIGWDPDVKSSKTDSTNLIAKALAMDGEVKPVVLSESGSFFDCNICLEMARDPVLTCCGHLFCWPCFYQLPYVHSDAKECPVCRGEVVDQKITPIYGNGNNTHNSKMEESGLNVPPRPQANRVESVRQTRVNQRSMFLPIEERIREISTRVTIRDHQASPVEEGEGSRRFRGPHYSRQLGQRSGPISAFSTELNSAETMVANLEAFIHASHIRRGREVEPTLPLEGQTLPLEGPLPLEDTSTGINITVSRSSSSRRRIDISRNSEMDMGGVRSYTRRRRRRLN